MYPGFEGHHRRPHPVRSEKLRSDPRNGIAHMSNLTHELRRKAYLDRFELVCTSELVEYANELLQTSRDAWQACVPIVRLARSKHARQLFAPKVRRVTAQGKDSGFLESAALGNSAPNPRALKGSRKETDFEPNHGPCDCRFGRRCSGTAPCIATALHSQRDHATQHRQRRGSIPDRTTYQRHSSRYSKAGKRPPVHCESLLARAATHPVETQLPRQRPRHTGIHPAILDL